MNEPSAPTRVVGIGASAGGLESLERLFTNIPPNTGMAFVVVQHLSPNFKSLMTELLSRHCTMPVQRAADGMLVQANNVYLLPPRKEIIIRGGRLALTDKDPDQMLTLPIDRFFRSLAHDAGEDAIAIVLSGSGSDGSRGLVDVRRAGGIVLAESIESAGFDGMPRAAVATGAVDHVASAEDLPGVLARLVQGRVPAEIAPAGPKQPTLPIDDVVGLLHESYGIDFSHYRTSTVGRRLERRVALRGYGSLEDYVYELQRDPSELSALYRDLLIGVTQFFRDPSAFEVVEKIVIPKIIERTESGEEIRMWVAGCATGEEAYSLAMLLTEQLTAARRPVTAKIIATDLDRQSLEVASAGVYPASRLANVNDHRRARFFTPHGDDYKVTKNLRGIVVFAPHNVIGDAPFTRMHLISCRNLLIYLDTQAQKSVLSLFHFGLGPDGVLMLGSSESPGALSAEFEAIDERWKVYRKRRDVRLLHQMRLPTQGRQRTTAPLEPRSPGPDGHLLSTYDRLLDRFMPPSVLVDENNRLLDTFAGAERWLRVKARRPTTNFLDMLDKGARPIVGGLIKRALKTRTATKLTNIQLRTGKEMSVVSVRADPLPHLRGGLDHVLVELHPMREQDTSMDEAEAVVSTEDPAQIVESHQEVLEEELAYTKETLQTTIEELETSNEELQSTNEELIASNEELQSTNEELHSVNEELYTVNAEHQKNISELQELNTDMQHLIESSEIATVFLDDELRIRRYTPRIADVFHILPQDHGRRIHDFSHNIVRPSLMDDIETVLRDGTTVESEVRDVEGTPYFLRILPYRPRLKDDEQCERITSGVVLTLTDIGALTDTRSRLAAMSAIVESSDDAIIGANLEGKIVAWNRGATQLFGHDEDVTGRNIEMLCLPEDLIGLREALEIVRSGRAVERFSDLRLHRSGKRLMTSTTMSPVYDGGEVIGASIIARDISALWRARRDAQERQALIRLLLDSTAEAIFGLDTNGVCTFCNQACAGLLGYDDPRQLVGETMHDLIHGCHADGSPYPRSECPIHRSYREGISVHNDEEFFTRADGSRFHVEYRSHPLRQDGETIGSVVTFLDITERKRSEEEMRTAARRREQFLAMLSHELRNPLAAVLNATALLEEDDHDEDEIRHRAHKVIERQTRHMARLLDDLLDVSRITSGKFQLRKRTCDLQEAILAAIESVEPKLESGRVELHTDLEIGPLPLRGDPARLQQVISNLLSNAVRHSKPGGTVELRVQREVDGVEIVVRDHGDGIPSELLPQIFDLFVQSDQHIDRSRGGLGVGLTLVRQIVELHGGSVKAHSAGKDRGSELTVHLPLAVTENPAEPMETPPPEDLPRRIVLVEDQPDAREMLELLLTARGNEVTTAEDGPSAIEVIERMHPDVAIVDIGLPTMSGYEVARRVRAKSELDDVALVALTGYGTPADVQSARDAGFDEHMTKPTNTDRLEAILARCHNRSH